MKNHQLIKPIQDSLGLCKDDIIAHGTFSFIYSNDKMEKDRVIIINSEKNKSVFLEKLYMKLGIYFSSINEQAINVTKLDEYEFPEDDVDLFNVLQYVSDTINFTTVGGLDDEWPAEYFEGWYVTKNKKMSKTAERIWHAIDQSFDVISELPADTHIAIDLHPNQFLMYNNEPICIDPVLFSSEKEFLLHCHA